MKKIIESIESDGLEKLLGENVLLMCGNYFYTGILIGVNADCVLLRDPEVVYETGAWSDKNYKDSQKMHVPEWYVRIDAIESFGVSK